MLPSYLQKSFFGYAAGIFGVGTIAFLIQPLFPEVRILVAANILLIIILIIAITWGLGPAVLSSILGALYVNYYFVPPTRTFDMRINGSVDEVALVAFLITAVTVGRLSANAKNRVLENRRLYHQLQSSFDQATKLEVIQRSERLKSALLDSVTHDLRTPLTSIKAAVTAIIDIRTMSSPAANASEDELLGVVVQQSNRLNHFIEGMIELASVEGTGDAKIAEAMPVDEIIGAAIARADGALRDHVVTVQCQDDLKVPANAKAVAQALFSFLENAGKYAPPGTLVRVVAEGDFQGQIRIAVEDQGPGVPVEIREKIFDRFFRGDIFTAQDARVRGLGLGLAIARSIVEIHGGRIWVEERESGEPGARFVFTLPLRSQLGSSPTGKDRQP